MADIEEMVQQREGGKMRATDNAGTARGWRSPYRGCICDICRAHLRVGFKGRHVINQHPEYCIHREEQDFDPETSYFGRKQYIYYCGFCGEQTAGPALAVEHVQKKHPELMPVIEELTKKEMALWETIPTWRERIT